MDRSWIHASRLSDEYANGIKSFIEFTANNDPDYKGELRCPCRNCFCMNLLGVDIVKEHIIINGFDKGYTKWIWHGESVEMHNNDEGGDVEPSVSVDRLDDMFDDVEKEISKKPEVLDELLTASEKPLYGGCTKHTLLSSVMKLFNLKARHGISDKGFTDLLNLVHEILPDGNLLPRKTYDAKKLLCPMGMGYKKIHACPNDCMLFTGEYEQLHHCIVCGTSRYKKKDCFDEDEEVMAKGPPAKVVWYLPIIPRLKRLFAKPDDADNLTWYSKRSTDGRLRHPADSPQWKMIDSKYPDFGNEVRNLRFGLCTDGINPHGNLSSKHSSWPVLLVIYNLPPWLCMKRKYIMLSLMISGPRQPGNDIDVYLRPLIDDLKILWNDGVQMWDGLKKEQFVLRAMVFTTINDFPAYGNLAGYSVKGHNACPVCEEDTKHEQLKHGRKTVYLRHRRFLKRDHPYRKRKKAFNGHTETEVARIIPLTGDQVYEKVKNMSHTFGKSSRRDQTKSGQRSPYRKCSIFFELPYWSSLYVRHSLDIMHIEKNVCDSLLGTLLNIPGKTKDTMNSRLDMVEMGIRSELAPIDKGKRTYLPPSLCNLTKKEKLSFCQTLRDTKVPHGFSSNIKNLVSMPDQKLVGLKSHDCHVLIQHFIPIAIRSVLPSNVRVAITNICLFFKMICAHSHSADELDKLQEKVVETVCQLEMYFPPSFFDIMVHLVVHITYEVKMCGPVDFRWMYPFERSMKVLKGYVKNRYRPEACIVERYVTEEVLDFVTDYLAGVNAIGVPKNRHESSFDGGRGTRGMKVLQISTEDLQRAHLYILHNNEDVDPYITKHQMIIAETCGDKKTYKWKQQEHNRTFAKWFEEQIRSEGLGVKNKLIWLSKSPPRLVISYTAYDINGYCFYTEAQDQKSTMQNSGVCVVASATHYASSKDNNPIGAEMAYYGVIQEIWEIDYGQFRIPIFKCKWFDTDKKGTYVDSSGFTLVSFNREGHKDDPFVLATQAKQVFYKRDPLSTKTGNWHFVLDARQAFVGEKIEYNNVTLPVNIEDFSIDDPGDEEFTCTRDGAEGLWVDAQSQK